MFPVRSCSESNVNPEHNCHRKSTHRLTRACPAIQSSPKANCRASRYAGVIAPACAASKQMGEWARALAVQSWQSAWNMPEWGERMASVQAGQLMP